MLRASAQVWGSGSRLVGDLEEKGNHCVSTLLTETSSSSCYQKRAIEPKQLLLISSQLQKVIADCVECSWFSAQTDPPQDVEGGGCPRASIWQAMAFPCLGPCCRACVPPQSAPQTSVTVSDLLLSLLTSRGYVESCQISLCS